MVLLGKVSMAKKRELESGGGGGCRRGSGWMMREVWG